MNFFLQLNVLLWKNYKLRRRQWGRLLIELVWPLFLFIILCLVRLRGLRRFHHQCHFDEKAMPSAGLGSFARSFVCTFNNTCHMEAPLDISERSTYNDTFISQVAYDVERALENNFSPTRVRALTAVFGDFLTFRQIGTKVGDNLAKGGGIPGLTVNQISSLFKDPGKFSSDLLKWADEKGIQLKQGEVAAFLQAKLTPERVSPAEFLTMLTDPRTAICDPEVVSKFVEANNMTEVQFQAALSPLCNLSVDSALELMWLSESHIDWDQMQGELEEFSSIVGGHRMNVSNYREVFLATEDVRRDLLEQPNIKKVIGDVSNLLRQMSEQLTADAPEPVSNNLTSSFNLLFSQNTSANSRMAFAAFQRVVCGRNMSSDQLFSDGGVANAFDELRDQLKEQDDIPPYAYDNTTSKECNDLMKGLEQNRLSGFLWEQMKPFIRGKILFSPDTPATRKLVGMVNATFRPIEDIQRLANMWTDVYSDRVRGLFLDNENQEFIKTQFTSDNAGTLLDVLLTSNLTRALNAEGESPLIDEEKLRADLKDYFAGNFSATWEETLDTVDYLVKELSTYLSCFDFNKFVPMPTEHALEVEGIRLIRENKLWAGLVFLDFPTNTKSDKLPEFIKYKIRLDSDKVDTTIYIEDRLSRPGPRRRPGIDLKYLYFGFAYLQDMLEHSIISLQSGRNKSDLPGIYLQQMPYPCYIEDRFIMAISRTFPLFMTLAWVYSASMIIKSIVYEKEQRLKETMRTMGLGNAVHWAAWFVDSIVVMSASAFMLTVLLTYGDVLTKTNPWVTFLFMMSYTLSTITLCFLVSTLFSRANVAAAAGGIVFFCFYLPYSFMVVWEEQLSSNFKMFSCIVSNIAFGFGCAYLSHYEESGIGAQWDNMWISPMTDDKFSLGGAIAMMLFDAFIYGLMAWYIETVWPGQYGVPKPWYFFLTKNYWIGSTGIPSQEDGKGKSDSTSDLEMAGATQCNHVETEPEHLPLGVSIQHLTKVYSNGKVAVEDLSLNFYEGQITSFLGHNGAGKTTTISILTGLFPPSDGTAKINGLDIRRDMDDIRKSLGTCPQHNVLFDNLTVFEHLRFYARLKGRSDESIAEEAEQTIKDLGLPHKRDELACNLSGGMQRKLSIACAFIGGSRVVVLDEPTAGVDPYSRRAIWDLLTKYKSGRTVILTTHFMDEADLLGDRIAIINNGKLACVGSSLFLRARFGNGYYLTIVKDDGSDGEEETPIIVEEEDDLEKEFPSAIPLSPPPPFPEDEDATDGASASTSPRSKGPSPKKRAIAKKTHTRQSSAGKEVHAKEEDEHHGDVNDEFEWSPASEHESVENDILIDDEGISDIAKRNGIVINPSGVPSSVYEANHPTTKFIQKFVPGARLLEQIGSEVIYVLPTAGRDAGSTKHFEILFAQLERYKEQMRIKSYGLSDTTLEEIFLKVASNPNDGDLIRNFDHGVTTPEEMAHVTGRVRSASESSGLRHLFSSKKKKVAAANQEENEENDEDVSAMIRDGEKEVELDKDEGDNDKEVLVDKMNKAQISTLDGASVQYRVPTAGGKYVTSSSRGHTPPYFMQHRDVWSAGNPDHIDSQVPTSEAINYTAKMDEIERGSSTCDEDGLCHSATQGCSIFWRHIKALQIKRFHHSKRNRKGILCEIILPALFVCLAMVFTLILPPLEEQKPIDLHPWMYPAKKDYPTHMFFSNSHGEGDWPRRYEEELLSKTGMGARCVDDSIYPYLSACKSSAPDTSRFWSPEEDLDPTLGKECACQVGTQVCPAGAEGPTPPRVQMPSYDILYNMTGRNISDYLIKTRGDFYKRRYGGFEFGVHNPLAKRNLSQAEDIADKWLKATNNGESRLDPLTREIIFGGLEDVALSSAVFDNVRVWFNNKGWAASVAYMNAVNNVILRASIRAKEEDLNSDSWDMEFKDPTKYGIAVITHPMNYTRQQLDTEVIRQIGISLLHAICIIFAMSFIPASFVIFHIEERTSKVRHLQFVSGVEPTTYWVSAFLWDMSMYLFSAFLCVLIFIAFDAQAYVSPDNFPSLLIIMFLYGFASIPLMYPASFLFSIPSSAFVTLSCTNLFIGIITTVTTFVLENFEDDELKYVGSILREVFLIFPHYCLGRGLMDMATEMNINLIVARFGLISDRSRFAWNFLGKYMICMMIQGVIFFLLTLAIQLRLWKRLPGCLQKVLRLQDKTNVMTLEDKEDEDVARERKRVMNRECRANGDEVLLVKELVKTYGSSASGPAVDRLTFGVRRGECFGLLGVNGAGKTTTFKMLTGDSDPTDGDAIVNGASILTDLPKVRRSLGYCPQFDALNPLLTGREHLRLYARLRGLDEDNVKKVADWGLKKLGLVPYADRCAGTYSGGNRRKLATAIALVGNPSVVFLDEPTTGMDPGARRFLWNCILAMVRAGQSVVLTSHSMEECEALCTRMGIMVNGAFQCLGSAQHLKNRFGSGYTLTLRASTEEAKKSGSSNSINNEAIAKLKDLVSKTFPLAELKEEHYNQLQYQLPLSQAKLPVVFREMEKAKAKTSESGLEDYSITQTTLDEVFIRFASKQTETRGEILEKEKEEEKKKMGGNPQV